MSDLTIKQKAVYDAIIRYSEQHGHPPSFRELVEELGYRSTGSIYRLVKSLKAKGILEQSPRSWRNMVPATSERLTGDVISVEIIGRISRHRPPELLSTTETVALPVSLVSPETHVYGLTIQDASFLDEHILPGDLILVEPTDTFQPGELVLASTNQTIIGHYYEEDTSIRLRSSPYTTNDMATSILLKADETQVWGAIVGLIRNLGIARV